MPRRGYTRGPTTARITLQQIAWSWMCSRRRAWTVADVAAASGLTYGHARRYVQRLHEAGYLAHVGEMATERHPTNLWRLIARTGPIAPALAGGALGTGVRELNEPCNSSHVQAK